MTKAQSEKIKQLTKVLKAVRERCLDCSAYSAYEVKKCVCRKCPLYNYRFGMLEIKEEKSLIKNEKQSKNDASNGEVMAE